MTFATPNLMPAAAEMFVFGMACAVLVIDLFLSDRQRILSYVLTQLTLLGALLITVAGMTQAPVFTFSNMFVADRLADVLKIAIYGITAVVFAYSRSYLIARAMFRGEYFVLGLFGVVGMMIMVSASHFVTLYLGLELLSLSLYAMVAFQRDSTHATEAAMKYFVLGAIASGILLYGMSLLYGVTGSLDISVVRKALAGMNQQNLVLVLGLVFVIVGLAFKLGAVPFHMWVPDVYHGAPTAVTLYIGTAPKIAAFAMVMRLLVGGLENLAAAWQDMLIVLAILSIAAGNVIAIAQDNIKRMLAYSSISHMGFFLLGILSATPEGYSAAMFYVLIYAVMSAGAFGVVVLMSRAGFEADKLSDFKGLNQRSPWYAFLMLLLMFSMAGVPPTVGFYAKLLVIKAALGVNLVWLAIVAVLLAVIGAYYYLRVVKLMYFDSAEDTQPIAPSADLRVLVAINALALIAIMPWVGSIIALCQRAIAALA